MKGDYYSVLGVSPTSEDVVIRAAYRAMMRRYHPDADPSEEATERARLINAAYAVLSDPEQRRRYDGTLAARGLIKLDPQRKSRGVRVTPAGVAVLALVTAAAAAFALSPPLEDLPGTGSLLGGPAAGHAAGERAQPRPVEQGSAETDCSTEAAKGLIKAELFNRAARLSGSDPEFLTPVADRSLVRIDLAEAKGGQGAGTVSCGGWLAIDLPTDVAVEGGRRNLNAEIIYALIPAGSRGFRLTALAGANGLIKSLATLGQAPDAEVSAGWPNDAGTVENAQPPNAAPKPSPDRQAAAMPQPAVSATRSPRRMATVRQTVSASGNVAALDKHVDLFMAQSLARADAEKQATLAKNERRFRKRREACRSEACLTSAYVAEMRAVSEIMAGQRP